MQLQSLMSWFVPTFNPPGIDLSRARSAATGLTDDRRYIRSRITAKMTLCWLGTQLRKKQADCKGVNMSSVGAMIMSPEAIPVGSAVYLHSKELQLMGNATVRHCTQRRSKFMIGVEFNGPLLRSY